ncbi:MAG: class I SAM-dependent methyltransferase [Candidatus Omnitrophica bacterium]|nr:class I SAM-dependent methyltransferase [Candidatus Omnitrophota bacterium]
MDYKEQELYCEHYIENEKDFRSFARNFMKVVSRHQRKGRLLDIGCAVGFMLEEARTMGFEAKGIELNEKARQIASSKGFEVTGWHIGDPAYKKSAFDVILLNHVLEHISEPNGFMKDISNILKDTGILVIGVPNHASLVVRLYRNRWYGWGIPEHIWHFDRKSLAYLLSRNGFRIKELVQNSQRYNFSKSLRKNSTAILAKIGNMVGSGDQLIAVAEKAWHE